MKKLKEIGSSFVLCLFELIAGVLLLINPVGFTSGIIIAAGAIMVITGLINIFKYCRTNAAEAARGQLLTLGLIGLAAGSFCILHSDWFLATFPVLSMIYGVVILFTGFSKIQLAVDLLRLKRGKWYWAAINAVISILCAVTVLGNPFATTSVLWIFTGCSLIVEAVIDVVTWVMGIESRESKTEAEPVEDIEEIAETEEIKSIEGEIV